jgi:hypothetical protein
VKYRVEVKRTQYAYQTMTVEADSLGAAKQRAIATDPGGEVED